MPRVIDIEDTAACELAECSDALAQAGFNPKDEGSLAHSARWLRRLGNNRSFLGDIVIDELKQRHREPDAANAYGPQVIMLSPVRGDFFLRANIWPSRQEHSFRASGNDSFVYELPHDHNFDFLTLGYMGPGYWSDYYEYDFAAVQGFVGEPAGLKFVERSRLSQGKIQLYRAHLDVHRQLPPDALSVSLNIMHFAPGTSWFDQYCFDVEQDTVMKIANPASSEVFLRLAVGLGGDDAVDLAHEFAATHPSDRMRLTAWETLAGIAPDQQARDDIWGRAERSGTAMVRAEAQRKRVQLA